MPGAAARDRVAAAHWPARRSPPEYRDHTGTQPRERALRGLSFEMLVELAALVGPLQRASHSDREGQGRCRVVAGGGGERDFADLARQDREVRRSEVEFPARGIGAGEEAAHARVRRPGVVDAQRRNLTAVEGDHRRTEKLDLRGGGAHGHVDDDSDATDDRQLYDAGFGYRGLVAFDHDGEAAFAIRRILRDLHLEAIADGAACRQCDQRPLDSHPRPAAVLEELILETDPEG